MGAAGGQGQGRVGAARGVADRLLIANKKSHRKYEQEKSRPKDSTCAFAKRDLIFLLIFHFSCFHFLTFILQIIC